MEIKVNLTKEDILLALQEYIQDRMGFHITDTLTLLIETKSKQNYRSEWEQADFRASLTGTKE